MGESAEKACFLGIRPKRTGGVGNRAGGEMYFTTYPLGTYIIKFFRIRKSGQILSGINMNGCDVEGCQSLPLLGWRPLAESLGRKIREKHWRQHLDDTDSFDLFEGFGFKRPAGLSKQVARRNALPCASGAGRKQRQYVELKNLPAQPCKEPQSQRCRACPAQRQPGHTYCQRCSRERYRQAHQRRQRRYRAKRTQAVRA
jgi:hypothetical protein